MSLQALQLFWHLTRFPAPDSPDADEAAELEREPERSEPDPAFVLRRYTTFPAETVDAAHRVLVLGEEVHWHV